MLRFGSILLASLVILAGGAAQAASGLTEFRHRTQMPVFDPRQLTLRWIDAVSGIDHGDVADVVRRAQGSLAILWRDKDRLVCNCTGVLKPDEVLINAEPVVDAKSGSAISIDEPTYVTFAEQIGYPLTGFELDIATMDNLAYVNNSAPLAAFLDQSGFVLDFADGMLNAGGLINPQNLHLFVAHRKDSGAIYVAIRGTADLGDMTTNFSTTMVPWKPGAGMVHQGYHDAADAAVKLVRPVLARLHGAHPDAPIYATGHSLGAAVAVLMTLDLRPALPIHAATVAMPPLGDSAFALGEAKALKQIDSYFVAHDEIRSLAYLAHRHHLDWVGHEIDLGDVGMTGGHYHYVINYMKGMMRRRGLAVEPYERAVPICVLHALPCLTDRHATLPLCVFDDPKCLSRYWPAMAVWLNNPLADIDEHLEAARTLQRDLVAGTIMKDLKPLAFAELAAWHGAADPATGLRFLDTAERMAGDTWLLRQIRARLTAAPKT